MHIITYILAPVGLIYILFGLWQWRLPPKKINKLMGYRTRRSMQDQASWDFAQVMSGKYMFYSGIAAEVLALILFLLPDTRLPWMDSELMSFTTAAFITLAFGFVPVYLTERKLRQRTQA